LGIGIDETPEHAQAGKIQRQYEGQSGRKEPAE
jgi:hypothetical protein